MLTQKNFIEEGIISPSKLAVSLFTTKKDIARTLGIGSDTLTRRKRIKTRLVQTKLREMLEILTRAEPQTGSFHGAYAWYRSEALPGFGGQTPEQLVREGHADMVRKYLDRVMAGGFA